MESGTLPPNYDGKSIWRKLFSFLVVYWRNLIVTILPCALLPFLVKYYEYLEVRCAFVVILMSVYWIFEALPMPVISLMPVALFPLFDVLTTNQACRCYMNDTIMVFVGGMALALAIEHSNLHLRMALGIMKIVGCSHVRLLGGLVMVTTFMSMWVSNTATTAMMVPIIFAVLTELEKAGLGKVFKDVKGPNDGESISEPSKVTRGYLIGVAYAASFGGTATLVGTGTNLVFKGIFEKKYPKAPSISFAQWMIWSTPQAFFNSFLTWVYILIFYFGVFRPKSQTALDAAIGAEGEIIAKKVILDKYKELGKMTFHEKSVAMIFLVLVCLWLTRKPGFTSGWYELIVPDTEGPEKIQDSMPVIAAMIMLFIIPKDLKFLNAFSKDANKRPKTRSDGLLPWKLLHNKIPWGLMFLLGGGFAIAEASKKSYLSHRIGESLSPLKVLPPHYILLSVCLFINTFTELTSNIGVANIVLPIISQMSRAVNINPMFLMIPATVMCSYSFRLPAATPPNALITMVGKIPIKYLVIGGCIPSIYSLVVVLLSFPTWGCLVYDIDVTAPLPEWAHDYNLEKISNNSYYNSYVGAYE